MASNPPLSISTVFPLLLFPTTHAVSLTEERNKAKPSSTVAICSYQGIGNLFRSIANRTEPKPKASAKSSLFRGGFQSFRGTLHSNAQNGISFRKLWHSRFYTGYFYALQKRLETSLSGRRRLVHWLIGRSPS